MNHLFEETPTSVVITIAYTASILIYNLNLFSKFEGYWYTKLLRTQNEPHLKLDYNIRLCCCYIVSLSFMPQLISYLEKWIVSMGSIHSCNECINLKTYMQIVVKIIDFVMNNRVQIIYEVCINCYFAKSQKISCYYNFIRLKFL